MLAAALALWAMFGLWVAGPSLGLSRGVQRTAGGLLGAELAALLLWSYGCEPVCTPAAEALGTVARVDIPVLTAGFVAVLLGAQVRRLRAPGRHP